MKKLAKFGALPSSDRRLLIEASLLLLAARTALRVLPFRTIVDWVSRRAAGGTLDENNTHALVQRVRWAVEAGVRHGPGTAVCFPQAIAAHLLLARGGAPSTIYYGVAKDPEGALEAHVWVRAGPFAVIGCEAAPRFTLMTTFPRGASPQPRSTQ